MSLREALGMRSYWGKLVGCAGGWALFDVTFYGNQLFQARVLSQIFSANTTSHEPLPVAGDLHSNRALQMLVVAAIGLPGYYVSVLLMDKLGRRLIQVQGFFMMAVTYAALGLLSAQLRHAPALMLFLYGLTFFFSNFGPNSTTFILPSETFPPHLRSTLNGFCAASGKLGAVLGSAVFVPLKTAFGVGGTMTACAVVALLGLAVTLAFVEDRRGKGMEGDEAERGLTERATPHLPSEVPSWRA
jgi:PHS family inorganic phosphate transporter-like MFS transporter